jgi:hypothetical protein
MSPIRAWFGYDEPNYSFLNCLSASVFWQREGHKFGNGAAGTGGDDDELQAVDHVRHRKPRFISR